MSSKPLVGYDIFIKFAQDPCIDNAQRFIYHYPDLSTKDPVLYKLIVESSVSSNSLVKLQALVIANIVFHEASGDVSETKEHIICLDSARRGRKSGALYILT